jgi:hypothetical protein
MMVYETGMQGSFIFDSDGRVVVEIPDESPLFNADSAWDREKIKELAVFLQLDGLQRPTPTSLNAPSTEPEPDHFVYEISACEEHQWQESYGLYATREGAVARAKDLCRKQVEDDRGAEFLGISVVEAGEDTFVLHGAWTRETFNRFIDDKGGFWYYSPPFDHYGAFAVFRRPIND